MSKIIKPIFLISIGISFYTFISFVVAAIIKITAKIEAPSIFLIVNFILFAVSVITTAILLYIKKQ